MIASVQLLKEVEIQSIVYCSTDDLKLQEGSGG